LPEKSNFCNDSKPPREDGIVPAILYSGRLISITTLLLNDPVNETPVHVTKIELVGLPSTHTQPLCDAPISIAEASSHINVSSETVGDEVGLTVGAVVGWKVGAIVGVKVGFDGAAEGFLVGIVGAEVTFFIGEDVGTVVHANRDEDIPSVATEVKQDA